VEAALVHLVANAHYDVTRYPGHVARLTNPVGEADVQRRRFLGRALRAQSYTPCEWTVRSVLAYGVTCLAPLCAMAMKVPDECSELNLKLRDGGNHSAFVCNLEKRKGTILAASVSTGLAAPAMYAILTLMMSLSLSVTKEVYRAYVTFTLWWFSKLRRHLAPITMNYLHKPRNHELNNGMLGTLRSVWKRLWFFPYTICVWFFTIEAFFLGLSMFLREPSWGGILALFIWQAYLPTMCALLAARSSLQSILTSELRSRPLEEGSGQTTDLWLRLFNSSSACFCCTRSEADLIIKYFEDSHSGYTSAYDQVTYRWPIWWHDDLCLTGSGVIQQVYIEDLDVVIPRDVPNKVVDAEMEQSIDMEDESMAFEIEAFLTSFHRRMEQLREHGFPQDAEISQSQPGNV